MSKITAQGMKEFFLDNAEPLIQQYIDAALGDGELLSTNSNAREEVWSVLKALMLSSSSKVDIKISSIEDVLTAVTSGDCTLEEGKQLLSLYKQVKEINSVGMLTSGAGGLTINILGSEPRTMDDAVLVKPVQVIEHEDDGDSAL